MPKNPPARVQSADITFELHTLGWKAFQQLCASIVGEVWGQVVQAFYESNDGGRDGAFRGVCRIDGSETVSGSFTVQCKFTAKPDSTLTLSGLSDELAKAQRLAAAGLADNYLIFTNARLTGRNDEQIRAAFEAVPGVKHCASYGGERLTQIIRESPRLRMLVPRVYGLGDLSQILDERAYAQAAEILSALGDDLGKFVITAAYERSARALVEHGFVLLLGEPACGKSTIAAALALGAIDEWSCSTLKVRDADDFVRHSNPHHVKQFFWVDDAFGATQLDWRETLAWNRTFPHVQAAIRRGAKVIFTSRDYIYQAAKRFLKQSALPVIQESQVVIRVEQMSQEEKEQILYNHIRLGSQSLEFKRAVKPLLESAVAAHPRFSPEIARRLGNKDFTKRLVVGEHGLRDFVARPMDLLKEVIQTLDASSRSAIALVFMRGGALSSPVTLTLEEERAVGLMGGSLTEVRNSLVALDGSLLVQVLHEGAYVWRFKHPTIRDAMAALVAENRELMDIYLAGTPLLQLFGEVSCGETGVQGVKVIVPNDRFDILLARMQTLWVKKRQNWDSLNRFLAYRCSREFLTDFVARTPWFVSELRVGSYLSAVSDVDVITRLHECGLLPADLRLRHVETIRGLAVQTPDADFLREDIQSLFEGSEREDILDEVRTQLLPRLPQVIGSWQDEHDGSEDPENYFDNLKSALKEYRSELSADTAAVAAIDAGLHLVDEAIDELRSRLEQEDESYEDYRDARHVPDSNRSRSVFDDVDQ